MTVTLGDSAIFVVDTKFGSRVAADFSAAIDSFFLRVEVSACTLRSPSFDVPAPVRVRDNMVGLRSIAHGHFLSITDSLTGQSGYETLSYM